MKYPMQRLFKTIGITKQAVCQYKQRQELFNEKIQGLILEVNDLRKDHPGCGLEKMYYTLKPNFLGRDKFIEAFSGLGYRVRKHKNYRKTTVSSKLYYPNLIKGLKIQGPSELWQSDITYIKVGEHYYYVVFIIDVYLRIVVGYCVSKHLRALANVKALDMALNNYTAPKIHHSDRGSQYIYKHYVERLLQNGSRISMGLKAQDNAYVERFHETIKYEYLKYWEIKTFEELKKCIDKSVKNYNKVRGHKSLKYKSPEKFANEINKMDRNIRPVLTIFNDNY